MAAFVALSVAVIGSTGAEAAFEPGPFASSTDTSGDLYATDDGSADLVAGQGPKLGGHFIVRCSFVRNPSAPMTARIAKIDPILAPNGTARHNHMFFGNLKTTSSPLDTDNGAPMERKSTGELQDTTCENSQDTASYWFPVMYKLDSSGVPRPVVKAGTTLYNPTNVRAYYVNAIPQNDRQGRTTVQNVPNGLMMVSGFPDGSLAAPPERTGQKQQVFWDCGASDGIATPQSLWPYKCQQEYTKPGVAKPFVPTGQVAHVLYPYCYNPSKTYSNNVGTGSGPNGQPLFASSAVRAGSGTALGVNNLEFPDSNGVCRDGWVYIPKISLRLHTMDFDPCGGATPCCPSSQSGCEDTPRNVKYRFADESGNMGSFYSLHADYWNTWKQGPATPNLSVRDGSLNWLTDFCLNDRNPSTGGPARSCSFMPDSRVNTLP